MPPARFKEKNMPALYDVAIPAFIRGLKNLSNMLEKGSAFAAEQGVPLSDLLDARLIDDMAPLTRQVQMVTDTAKFVAVRVGQVANTPWADDEVSYADVQGRVAKAIAFLEAASPDGFEGREDAKVVLTTPSGDIPFTGSVYVHGFAIPNFFFHLSMAYALLRMKGVPVGKLDFLGAIR
jgi:hypothetical protein